jgi:hypothetical protein
MTNSALGPIVILVMHQCVQVFQAIFVSQ